ncbi:MAG: LON peptidase substrate-binding domain-containing protein [Chloroflexota bacterium]
MDQPDLFSLPLFPLGTVLYPGMVLPLKIFEARYKAMINHCVDEKRDFGVVLIAQGKEVGETADPHTIGTIAKIIQVQHLNEAGEMAIYTVGTDRFKIWDHVVSPDGYMVGTLSKLDTVGSEMPTAVEMVSEARDALTAFLRLNYDSDNEIFQELEKKLSTDPEALSYQIAAMLNIDLKTKQDLLEMEQSADRLQKELQILNAEIAALKRTTGPKMFKLPGGGEVNLN